MYEISPRIGGRGESHSVFRVHNGNEQSGLGAESRGLGARGNQHGALSLRDRWHFILQCDCPQNSGLFLLVTASTSSAYIYDV